MELMAGKTNKDPTAPRSISLMKPAGGLQGDPRQSPHNPRKSRLRQSKIFDDTAVVLGYESVDLIQIDKLPRGGISLETKAVGRIQVCILL